MSHSDSFSLFIQRIRLGDEEAAVELVRQFEPYIRREIRFRLRDGRLRRLVDSVDICQTILKSFFVRVAAGQFELEREEDLPRLLAGMVRNRVAEEVRKQGQQRRDYRMVTGGTPTLETIPLQGQQPTPSRVLAGKELLDQVWSRLSDTEQQMVEMREQGHTWEEIANKFGGTAQARRVQLTRALDRVALELGIEEGHL